jgi:hypothetical protein
MNMSLAATMLGCIDFEEFGPVEIGLDPRKFLAEWCHQGELPGLADCQCNIEDTPQDHDNVCSISGETSKSGVWSRLRGEERNFSTRRPRLESHRSLAGTLSSISASLRLHPRGKM